MIYAQKPVKDLVWWKKNNFKLDHKSLEIMYTTFVGPVMEYGIVVWGGTFDINILKLEQINVEALRIITGATSWSNISDYMKKPPCHHLWIEEIKVC